MNYGLIYTLPFAGIDGSNYLIEIEKEDYIGDVTELRGQPSPFTVSIEEEEFLYTPMRLSTGVIHAFGDESIRNLYSTDYRMLRVTLLQNGEIKWCGFVRPEVFTQDWSRVKSGLDIECISALSVLQYVDYVQQGESRSTVSLMEILQQCLKESRARYSYVYMPHTYGVNEVLYSEWDKVLDRMYVSEQNFFDEEGIPMKLGEVLAEVMKLMNWTCTDWDGNLWMIDIDSLDGMYYKFKTREFVEQSMV